MITRNTFRETKTLRVFYLAYTGDSPRYKYCLNSKDDWNLKRVVPNQKLKQHGIAKGELHSLRACDIKTNSSRSNYQFVEGSGENKVIGRNTYYHCDEHVAISPEFVCIWFCVIISHYIKLVS